MKFDTLGTQRACSFEQTLLRVEPHLAQLGITRVANLTGLDVLNVPVTAVYRPNARSISVAQGKGVTMAAARLSGIMEALETFHAETALLPLWMGSARELRGAGKIVDCNGLPRLSSSAYHEDARLLWTAGQDLLRGNADTLVPWELVHLDFRAPRATGAGAFMTSSNGLASGNDPYEALSHALCELIERDANTLWNVGGEAVRQRTRVDPATIDSDIVQTMLQAFAQAGVVAAIWETTSDVGVPAFMCTLFERSPHGPRPMPPVAGSGCHPRRLVALLRAITEAAQGRLTIISGAREDLEASPYDAGEARARTLDLQVRLGASRALRRWDETPDFAMDSFEADVAWELERLLAVGSRQVIAVDLTRPDFAVPVFKVIVPYLEAMDEVPGYVLGRRARARAGGSS